MNIEDKIRNNSMSFDDAKMPEGSRERFEARLWSSFQAKRSEVEKSHTVEGDLSFPPRSGRNDDRVRKIRFMAWTSVAAAAVTILMIISSILMDKKTPVNQSQAADNKLVEMRKVYEARVDETIYNLEKVMKNADEDTRTQINTVIRELLDMGDVFAEIAPLHEERQMAITEHIYDNKLRTIELITEQINK